MKHHSNREFDRELSIKQIKERYFSDPEEGVRKVRESVWKAHWKNAKEASKDYQLRNLLNNHVRLYWGEPSSCGCSSGPDTSVQRQQIIQFLKDRLETEFGIDDVGALLDYALPTCEFEAGQILSPSL